MKRHRLVANARVKGGRLEFVRKKWHNWHRVRLILIRRQLRFSKSRVLPNPGNSVVISEITPTRRCVLISIAQAMRGTHVAQLTFRCVFP